MPHTTLTWGGYGDVTVQWETQNNDTVLPNIQKMIDAGIRFFILGKKVPFVEAPQIDVTDITQIGKKRTIVIPDESLEALHKLGLVTAGQVVLDSEVENTGTVAKTAEDVAANETVAVKPPSGG